jgi:hypothetical protein
MSDENMTVVRRFIRRFVEQDIDGALEDVHPEAELDWSNSQAPDSGIYTGHAGWRRSAASSDHCGYANRELP